METQVRVDEKLAAGPTASRLAARNARRAKARREKRKLERSAQPTTAQDNTSICRPTTVASAGSQRRLSMTPVARLQPTPPSSTQSTPKCVNAEYDTESVTGQGTESTARDLDMTEPLEVDHEASPSVNAAHVIEPVKIEDEPHPPALARSITLHSCTLDTYESKSVANTYTLGTRPESPEFGYLKLLMAGLQEVSAQMKSMNERVARIEETTERTDRRVRALDDKVHDVKEDVRHIHKVSDGVLGHVNEVREKMGSVEEHVEAAQETLNVKLGDMDERIRKVHLSLEDKMGVVGDKLSVVGDQVQGMQEAAEAQMGVLDKRVETMHES
ncbi:hypothetical protein B0A48_16734 [Cryoendolithus antarcticus]|uniref:Uncharacterized protein n=1 Tax=Cryoendolithus antarcticus TaxID=1507870 RepID=A0A1V8SDM9_9PEZI|nr:hypothetical protein B0A48_16734 [Cryoendolithus antarcticus]